MKEATKAPRRGAASSTIDALMYELRTFGSVALYGPDCQQRLETLSRRQLIEVIERLFKLRGQYPNITDELFYKLDLRLRKQ